MAVTRSGKIWTSADGGEWEPRNSGTSSELEAVIFGNGQFVTVGDSGVILTSPDGAVWTRQLGAAKHLRGVAYGSGLYVAVGSKGIMFRSSDGVSWSGDVSGTPDRLDDVTFAHGVFIALGENGTIISSTGSGWANETSGTRRDLDGMIVGQNQIVAVGKFGTILTSADGANYVAQNAGTTNDLRDAWFAGFNSGLVAVTWIGFDNPASLGEAETGGGASLPIWMYYMAKALKGVKEQPLEPPPGLAMVPLGGELGRDGRQLMEFVYAENAGSVGDGPAALREANKPSEEVRNQIF